MSECCLKGRRVPSREEVSGLGVKGLSEETEEETSKTDSVKTETDDLRDFNIL